MDVHICTHMIPARGSKTVFSEFIALGLLGLPRARLANHQNHWNSFFWAYWAYLGPTLPTSKIIGIHCSGPTGPTSGLPCQPAKSLECIALGLLGLPRAHLANQQNHWKSLPWAYWS